MHRPGRRRSRYDGAMRNFAVIIEPPAAGINRFADARGNESVIG